MVGHFYTFSQTTHGKILSVTKKTIIHFKWQIKFSRRLANRNRRINVIIDATECEIERPGDARQKLFYSGKDKRHTLKYELGVEVTSGFIVWLFGGAPGHMHDLDISRTSGILNHLLPGELILADKGYIGVDRFLTPVRQPVTDAQWVINSFISKKRVLVENVIGRVKVFHCLVQPWRNDLALHPIVMDVLCNLTNLEFLSAPPR